MGPVSVNIIPLMIILSCKSILISCGASQSSIIYICNGALWFAYQKQSWYFNIAQTLAFFLPMWDYGGAISRNILNAHFASPHCLI